MKKYFQVKHYCKATDAALLMLRLVCGIAFILHGWGKIQTPFSWMPAGAPVPGIFQALAAVAEFGGGIALILGLVTSLALVGLVITMIVAALFHASMGHPFVGSGGPSYEIAVVYLAIFITLLFIGPGRFSLDSKVFGQKA